MRMIDRKEVKEEIEALEKLGYKRVTATVLAFFMENRTSKTREIKRTTGLRDAEVSVGVRTLIDDGILTRTWILKEGKKGRAKYLYEAIPKDEILAMIEEKVLAEIKEKQESLKRLKQIVI